MENNQATPELATSILLDLYKNYRKEKKRAYLYSIIYYGILLFIIIFSTSFFQVLSTKKSNKHLLIVEDYIPVVEITGSLGLSEESDYKSILKLIKKAFEDQSSIGLVLDIDSGGGTAYDSHIIVQGIEKLKQAYPNKKVTSFVRSIAASGAYWVAASGEKIYADESSLIGSIGVMMQSINFHDFLLDHKIKPILVHSGAHKVAGSPLAEFTDEDLKIMQALTDSYYKIFTDGVKQSRGERLLINNDTFSGLVWLGKEAKELGLIDELKDFDEMIALEYGTYPVHYLRHQKDINFKEILHNVFKQLSTYSHLNKIGAYYGLFT